MNGGCFQIVAGLDNALCTNACNVFGSVFESSNYLCGTRVASFDTCASNSDCAVGTACKSHFRGNYCIAVC